jgi:hypothetical protein
MEVLDVWVHRSAACGMGDIRDFRQMELDPAPLAVWTTRRTARWPLDAATADLLPNLGQVLVECCLCLHLSPPFRRC